MEGQFDNNFQQMTQNPLSSPLTRPFLTQPQFSRHNRRAIDLRCSHSCAKYNNGKKQVLINMPVTSNMSSSNSVSSSNVTENLENNQIELFERNRQASKKCIEEDSKYLRQEIWTKIQTMFRKIQEYGEEFYEGIYKVMKSANAQRTNNINFNGKQLNNEVYLAIVECLKNSPHLYNPQKMNSINQKILKKVSQYFEDVCEKYMKDLYKMDYLKMQEKVQYSHVETKQQIPRKEYKSMSVQKYPIKNSQTNRSNLNSPLDESKDKEFKNMYEKISASKHTSKLVTREDAYEASVDSVDRSETPYGLNFSRSNGHYQQPNMETANFIVYNSAAYTNTNHLNTTNKSNGSIRDRLKCLSLSRPFNSTNDNILTGPILSVQNSNLYYPHHTEYLDHQPLTMIDRQKQSSVSRSRKSVEYPIIVGHNQQSITSEWIQQIALTGDIENIHVDISNGCGDLELSSSNSEAKEKSHISQQSIIPHEKQGNILLCLAICNGGENIAVGCQNALIYVYESMTKDLVTKLGGHTSAVCCLHYSNGLLFSGGDRPDASIYVWNTSNWTIRSKLSFHSAAISSLLVIPSTNLLISTSFDRTVKVFDFQQCQLLSQYQNKKSIFLNAVCFQSLQRIVCSTPTSSMSVFSLQIGISNKLKSEFDIECSDKISCIQKSASLKSNIVCVGLHNSFVELYSLPGGNKLAKLEVGRGAILQMVTFTRNSKNGHPLILMQCFASKILYLLNTQSGFVSQLSVKGHLNINVTQGVGPVIIASERKQLIWVDQSEENNKIHRIKFKIY